MYLELSNNQFASLPAAISELKNLRTLFLTSNKLSSLPIQIGELKNLKILNLSGNPIPKSEMEKIKKLLPNDCDIIFLNKNRRLDRMPLVRF